MAVMKKNKNVLWYHLSPEPNLTEIRKGSSFSPSIEQCLLGIPCANTKAVMYAYAVKAPKSAFRIPPEVAKSFKELSLIDSAEVGEDFVYDFPITKEHRSIKSLKPFKVYRIVLDVENLLPIKENFFFGGYLRRNVNWKQLVSRCIKSIQVIDQEEQFKT
jgi:hypothetical protein